MGRKAWAWHVVDDISTCRPAEILAVGTTDAKSYERSLVASAERRGDERFTTNH